MASTITDRLNGLSTSVAVKAPVRAATTAAITLSGLPVIDGIAIAAGDRVLVKNQADARENGIYSAASGRWPRTADFDGTFDAVGGTQVSVIGGISNRRTYWRPDGYGVITIGIDEIHFIAALTGAELSSFSHSVAYSPGTVGARLAQQIFVTDDPFNAKGDGVTDDFAALSAWIDFCAANKVRGYCAEGEYLISETLELRPDLDLDFHPKAAIRRNFTTSPLGRKSVLGAYGTGTDRFDNIHISGGIWDAAGETFGAGNIFGGYNFRNLRFFGCTFMDVVDTHAIDLANFDGVIVQGCRFLGFKNDGGRDYSEAIQIDNGNLSPVGASASRNIVVEGCYFGPNPDRTEPGWTGWGAALGGHSASAGIFHENVKFLNNTVEGQLTAGVRVFKWNNVIISGNIFRNSTARGVHITPYNNAGDPPARNITISDNIFDTLGVGALVTVPTANDQLLQYQDISITGNIFRNISGQAINASFIDGLVVSGNLARSVNTFLSGRFIKNASISGGRYEAVGVGIFINENVSDFPEGAPLVGTGLTSRIAITGNVASEIPGRAVHISCAARGVTISGIEMTNVGSNGTVPAIAIDAGADGVNISGASYHDVGAAAKATIGISVSATCKNVVLSDNQLLDAAPPISNAATGNSYSVLACAGSPEGVITSPPGSECNDISNGTKYMKKSGTGNTGWKLVTQAA